MDLRKETIQAVKAMNIQPYELDMVGRDTLEGVIKNRYFLLKQIKDFIEATGTKENAKDYFDEELWDDIGIADKRYKIVKVNLKKTIYQSVYVAIPDDESVMDADNYLDNLDYLSNDNPEDEDDWEAEDTYEEEGNLTAEEVKDRYSEEDLWNYNDFEEN